MPDDVTWTADQFRFACGTPVCRGERLESPACPWGWVVMDRLAPGGCAFTAYVAVEQAAKLDGYVSLIKQLDMEAKAAAAERDAWAMKAALRAKRADFLKDRLKRHLEATGQLRVETASGRTITVRKNGGQTPVVIDPVKPESLHERFQVVTVELDKVAVRNALDDGEPLGFARFAERGTHLQVK